MHIALEDPARPDIIRLLDEGEAYAAKLYPADCNYMLPLDALRAGNVRFYVARDDEGRALGTGAIVLHGDWAEIKRMWVVPEARGRGLARALLGMLESAARIDGTHRLRLETGIHNREALVLYRRAGFQDRGPFADYPPAPLSVFLEKDMTI